MVSDGSIMVSIDKAAIALTMAIVAIALGITASMGGAQDAGPVVSAPPTVSTETSQSDLVKPMKSGIELDEQMGMEETQEEETMMEESTEPQMGMKETQEEETMMEESTEPQTHMVDIPTGTAAPGCEDTNSCFSPANITINAGDTVEWVNIDSAAHTVTAGSPKDVQVEIFDSSLMMLDASWSFTFDETGNYDYFCMVHPWMIGSVTVK